MAYGSNLAHLWFWMIHQLRIAFKVLIIYISNDYNNVTYIKLTHIYNLMHEHSISLHQFNSLKFLSGI